MSTSDPRLDSLLAKVRGPLEAQGIPTNEEGWRILARLLLAALDAVPAPSREKVAEAIRDSYHETVESRLLKELWPRCADAAIAAGAGTGPADDESIRGGRLVIDQKQKYRIKQLEAAVSGLSKLVEGEYPDKYSLGEIADTWGGEYGVTKDEVRAMRGSDG